MKINAISASNFCGLRHVDVTLTAPVLMVTGLNGVGKSSLLDGIKLAVTGVPSRVTLKSDYAQMIKDGAKTGGVKVMLDGAAYDFDLKAKTGNHLGNDCSPAMPYVLDAGLFASASAQERRNLLFAITGQSPTPALIIKRLLERGCESDLVESIKPILRAGFEAAHKEAKAKATEARGAWKATTGETYGSDKANGWKVTLPESLATDEDVAKLQAELTDIEATHDDNTMQLGRLEQQWRDLNNQQGQIATLREKASMFDRLGHKLRADQSEYDRLQGLVDAIQAKPCPCCGESLVLRAGELTQATGSVGLPHKMPEYTAALNLMTRTIANDKTALAEAEAAAAALARLGNAPDSTLILSNIEALRIRLNALKTDRTGAQAALNQAMQSATALADAATKNANAAKYHADVQAWSKIADALAPDGIQGELLIDVLKIVNGRLRQSADDTGWRQVVIDADMNITADGRVYALLSESEQWRVNAVITEMISFISGVKMMLLDRMDVLDMPGRSECLQWLDLLASENDVETVVVAATLKEPPKRLPGSFQSCWIEGGELLQPAISEAA